MSRIAPRRRGIVLLIVLAVLALMSVLAISFVSMSRMERAISRNYVDRTRVLLVAESGVEYAISRVLGFRGGVLTPEEYAAMEYNRPNPFLPLSGPVTPSFQRPGESYSGYVSSTHSESGDRFKLQVEDESSKINLNDSNLPLNLPKTDPGFGNRRLGRIVSYLCELLFAPDYGPGIGDAIAIAIQDARDHAAASGFSSMDEVGELLIDGGLLSADHFNVFKRYFTAYSWTDDKVLRPSFEVSISAPDGASPPLNADGGANIYLYSDMQTTRFALDSRSPVNLNTAPVETLQTLLSMISGWYLLEKGGERLATGHYSAYRGVVRVGGSLTYSYLDESAELDEDGVRGIPVEDQMSYGLLTRTGEIGAPGTPSSDKRAALIAGYFHDRIHDDTAPNPIETWQEFDLALDDPALETLLTDASLTPLDAYEKDAIRANFNPNSRLNDYNPNASHALHIDKSQLTTHTTEFCFEPTGVFSVRSYGEIVDTDGSIAASQELETVVSVYEFLRFTTQADFMRDFAESGGMDDYFSESTGDLTAYCTDTHNGYTVQSYPEPLNDADYYADSVFDGFLMPATWQPAPEDFESTTVVTLYATFESGRAPDVWGVNAESGSAVEIPGYYTGFFPFYSSAKWREHLFNDPTSNRLTYDESADAQTISGSIFPDGALSDANRTIGFQNGNFGTNGGKVGSVQFWVKPNFDPAESKRPRCLSILHKDQKNIFGCRGMGLWFFCSAQETREDCIGGEFSGADFLPTRSFLFGKGYTAGPCDISYYMTSTVNHEFEGHSDSAHSGYSLYNFNAHTWNQIGLCWDYTTNNAAMCINGEIVSPARWVKNGGASVTSIWSGTGTVFGLGDSVFGGPEFLYSTNGMPMNYVADCTFDDVVGYQSWRDVNDMAEAWTWGRYYSEDDATYTSPAFDAHRELHLDRRVILTPRSVSWTLHWPQINRDRDEITDNLRPTNADHDLLNTLDATDAVPDDPMAELWGEALDPVSVDLARVNAAGGTVWQYDDRETMPTYSGGSRLKTLLSDGTVFELGKNERLRFRVHFNLENGQRLYDAPMFDDITITFTRPPKILSWKQTL